MQNYFKQYQRVTAMVQKPIIEKLNDYKLLVSEHFDLDRMILYGSYAKGTQKEDSDIDVAIVVNSIEGEFLTYAPLLWKLRRNIDERIEPILIRKDKDPGGFLADIMQTGVVI
jgi:uncharacterized protein